MQTAALHNQPV